MTHLALGSVLDGRYRIDALVAEGGIGAVYRATCVSTGREVAVKVLRPALANDDAISARFAREGELLSRLQHPNTVTTFGAGIAGATTMYIAMELLRGESLHDRIARDGALTWQQSVSIAQAVCAALAQAHALGIVHRDLKPSNIHLEPRADGGETAKVIDFGVAKIVRGSALAPTAGDDDEDLTYVGQLIGTPEYMAPEQIVGDAIDQRVDVYAVGALLYEMLTARRAVVAAESPLVMLAQVAQHRPPSPSALVSYASRDVTNALDAIVMRCLAADRDDRFASIGDVADALAGVIHVATPRRAARGSTSQSEREPA